MQISNKDAIFIEFYLRGQLTNHFYNNFTTPEPASANRGLLREKKPCTLIRVLVPEIICEMLETSKQLKES